MTAATLSPSIVRPSWASTVRLLLAAVALVVLIGASFVVGRISVNPAKAAPVATNTTQNGQTFCRLGRPC